MMKPATTNYMAIAIITKTECCLITKLIKWLVIPSTLQVAWFYQHINISHTLISFLLQGPHAN